jgi:hypothetical protein
MPVQSVFGGSYALGSALTLTAEWHHDGEGLGKAENRRLYDQIEMDSGLARDALMFGNPGGLPAIERLADAAGILTEVRQNKDTLFMTTGFSWGHRLLVRLSPQTSR